MSKKTNVCFTIFPPYTILFLLLVQIMSPTANGQLDYQYYDRVCPRLPLIVRSVVWAAMRNDSRIAASLLRLHFHDCIVDGCDASVLLDDTEEFKGEKNSFPNRKSLRGFDVIDAIKSNVEKFCSPQTVSCVDILTLAARDAVFMSGGPYWNVLLGRRDSTTASQKSSNEQTPSPFESLKEITKKFTTKGLDLKDVVVLSGAHTIGFTQCIFVKRRLFNFKDSGSPDPSLDSSTLANLRTLCPNLDSLNSNLAPLDQSTTFRFDNSFYINVINKKAILESDQALHDDPKAASLVESYSNNPYLFARDFSVSMIKLSTVGILTGMDGEIRNKCGSVN